MVNRINAKITKINIIVIILSVMNSIRIFRMLRANDNKKQSNMCVCEPGL